MCINIWLYFGLVIVPGVAYVTLGIETQVCYTKLGCFDLSPPYNHFTKLPASPEHIGTEIFLYTPHDKDSNKTIDWDHETQLRMSTFDITLPVKIIVHGFANSNVTDWLYDMKNEFLKKGDMNVIIVTWGPGAAFPQYHEAVANTRLVARQVEMLIRHIVDLGVAYRNIHLIGHSLGSHIAGHVGEIVKNKQQLLGRISGLDPAEPDFAGESKLVVLDPSDAMFVDVIHTSGAPLHQGGFGLMTPCGHVDFFINGGLEQPDCSSLAKTLGPSLENMLHLIGKRASFLDSLADTISCSHGRAHQVFTESINMAKGCQFTAYPCKSYEAFQLGECLSCGPTGCGVMGYMAEEYHARGNYFLNTRMSKPYCGHHYGIGLYLLGDTQTEGELHLKLNSSWGDSEWMNITGSTKTLFKGGHVMRSVTVSMDVVGRLHEVSLRFDQRQDGQHLRPLRPLAIEKMTVVSGESGHSYLVCLNRHLKDGEEVTAVARPFSGMLDSCPH